MRHVIRISSEISDISGSMVNFSSVIAESAMLTISVLLNMMNERFLGNSSDVFVRLG